MRRMSALSLFAFAVLLVGSIAGCDRGGGGAIPDSAEGRLESTVQALPSDAQMAFALSDLAAFRKNAKSSQKTIERLVPMESLINRAELSGPAKEFVGEKGVKVFEKKFWKDLGIAPDSAFTLAAVDYNGVVLTYVADKKKFEKELGEGADAKPKSIDVGGTKAKSLKKEDGDVVWAYQGKLATVVLPSNEMTENADKQPKTKKTLEKVLGTKPEKSLFATSGFEKYRAAAGDRPTLAYFRLTPFMKEEQLETSDEYGKKVAKSFRESLDGAGLLLDTEKNRIQTRLWLGLTDKGKTNFDEMFKSPVQGDWTKFATEKTLLALRSASNWKSMWDSVEGSMSKKDKKQVEQSLAMAKAATGLDIRKNVIGNLNGQSGIFVYGIGGKASAELLGNPMKAATNVQALYTLKFGDAKTLSKIAQKVDGMSEKYVKLRPLQLKDDKEVKAVQVLDLKMPAGGAMALMGGGMPGSDEKDAEPKPAPVRFFIHDDSLVLASSSIPEAQMYQMLTGEGEGAKALTEVENLDLGAKFAEAEQLSGLYVNFERFRSIFGDLVSSLPMANVKKAANTLEEALLATEPQENGLFVDLTIDLLPAKSGSGKEGSSK